MEQIQQLIEILKETPEMALWGLGLFFLFTLLKLASWIYALKVVFQQAIKKYFDYKDHKIELEVLSYDLEESKLKYSDAQSILDYFEENKISSVEKKKLINLIDSMIRKDMRYVFESDIENAIQLIKKSKLTA